MTTEGPLRHVSRDAESKVEPTPWGSLIWRASSSLAGARDLTVGHCLIEPGQQNGRHLHPNCEEVLLVTRGSIVHTWNDEELSMEAGDIIAIPPGVVHNARNVGDEIAEMVICFSSATRETIDVEVDGAGPASSSTEGRHD